VERFSIAFIGAGNMSSSIVGGLLTAGFPAEDIAAAAPGTTNLDRLQRLGVARVGHDNLAVAREADVVVLGVKPQVLREVCTGLAGQLRAEQLVLSIAAGVSASSIAAWLGPEPSVVRCMPNTPALLGSGASTLCAHGTVPAVQRERAERILSAVGVACWVEDEEHLHAATALAGSGPAYFFQLMEGMIDAATRMGLEADAARILCAQTCIGAGRMLAEGDSSAAELRRRVCSPGGTTEQAVAAFTRGQLPELVDSAMNAALERSRELARELA